VAAALNYHDLHAAPTIRNVPGVDLIVSDRQGLKSAAIQMKTAKWASRPALKSDSKGLDRYEWDNHFVENHSPSLFYAFVDLKHFEELPVVFLIPSEIVSTYYTESGRKREDWPRPRFHVNEEFLEPFRNNYRGLIDFLTQ